MMGYHGEQMISIVNKKNNTNRYAGNGWNFEHTTKYIISINQKLVEVGHFMHYLIKADKTVFVKEVIELPSSRGCPIKCAYCASSCISDHYLLTADEMVELFDCIYKDKTDKFYYLLVTMTGIGDYALCYRNINEALIRIKQKTINAHFTVSSCIWNKEAIESVSKLCEAVDIRSINITYVSNDKNKVEKLINYFGSHVYNVDAMVEQFNKTSLSNLRVNYLMIKDINDSEESFALFAETFKPLKGRITVRISKMNKTLASTKAGLYSPQIKSMIHCNNFLKSKGFDSYLFYSEEDDQMNCGQLLTETDC